MGSEQADPFGDPEALRSGFGAAIPAFARTSFMRGGIEALKASVAPGPLPLKTEAALRVITLLLDAPVANRPNWTIPCLMAEIEAREGVKIGRS